MRMKKRGLALVLALVLALSLLPISAFATEVEATPTATPTYKVGDTCTSDTKETSELPSDIPADTMWAYQGEVVHTHTPDCYGEKIELVDNVLGTFEDFQKGSTVHMWKIKPDGGAWWSLDCVPTNTDGATGEVHHDGSFDGHVDRCYGQRNVTIGDKITGTIGNQDAMYKMTEEEVATGGNWYALSCDAPSQYSWKLTTIATEEKLIKISYAWACATEEAKTAVADVILPETKEIVINKGDVAALPAPNVLGYEISGWYTEEACANKYESYTQLEGKSEITLYAKVAAPAPEVPAEPHTYKVQYIYMLKDAKTGVYGRVGAEWVPYTATSAPTIEGIWDALNEPRENNEITYNKRDVAYLNEDVADAGVDTKGNQKYTFKLYGEKQAPTTNLTIRMVVNGLENDKPASDKLTGNEADSLLYKLTHTDGVITRLKEFRYGTGEQPYSTGLTTITHTLMQYNADVPGYTLTTTCDANLGGDPENGYQFEVKAGENTVVTITNTYEKIHETVYSLIFDAGDNGVMRGAGAPDTNPGTSTTYRWTKFDMGSTVEYAWDKVGGDGAGTKTWIYEFTEENVAADIAMYAGKGNIAASPKTPDITANAGYAFQAFRLDNGTEYSMNNPLWDALLLMQDSRTTSLTYHAAYTGGPVNPPVDPNPPVETPILPGGDDGYEPTTPPVTPLPDPEVPLAPLPGELLTDLPQEEIPLADLPDEEVPLADLPEEEVPLAEAPKTGDSFGIWVALLGISSLAMAALVLGKRKETQEN